MPELLTRHLPWHHQGQAPVGAITPPLCSGEGAGHELQGENHLAGRQQQGRDQCCVFRLLAARSADCKDQPWSCPQGREHSTQIPSSLLASPQREEALLGVFALCKSSKSASGDIVGCWSGLEWVCLA